MPCVLRSFQYATSKIMDYYGNLQYVQLLVHFVNNPIPRGFFCCLVIQICQTLPKNWLPPLKSTEQKQHTYNNLITFHTLDTGHSISLIDKIGYLEILISHHEENPRVIHYEVQQFLTKALNNVCNHLQLDNGLLYYGFFCNCDTMANNNHIASLPKQLDPPPCWVNCSYDKMKLTPAHLVWLVPPKSLSSPAHSSGDGLKMVNEQRPTMKLLRKIVIPRIAARWEIVADYLEYEPEYKQLIRKKKCEDPVECCAELLEDWLCSDRGISPKT